MSSFTTKAVKGGVFCAHCPSLCGRSAPPPSPSCDGGRGAPSRGPAAVSCVCAPLCCLGTSLAPGQATEEPEGAGKPASLRVHLDRGIWRVAKRMDAARAFNSGPGAARRRFPGELTILGAFPGLPLTDGCVVLQSQGSLSLWVTCLEGTSLR